MKILTKSGFSNFHGVQSTGEQETLIFNLGKIKIEQSLGHRFVVNSEDVYQIDLNVGDFLETQDGLKEILSITPSYGETFDVLETKDNTYYQNGVLNHNCEFLGSQSTLLNQETLERLKGTEPIYIRDEMLKIWKDPQKGRKYILTVDQAKDGSDYFTVNIFDMTNFPFEQVQAQRLQIKYLIMPDYILEWAESYNYAYVIIENNEGQGQSIQDILHIEHEYENLHFDKKTSGKVRKNKDHPGFRTNKQNRGLILNYMKTFIEEGKLIIRDQDLVEEFKHFILVNGKYQQDQGYHDDLVMGCSFLFVPFVDLKNFDGYLEVIDALYERNEDSDFNFMDNILFGSFDQGPEEEAEKWETLDVSHRSYDYDSQGFDEMDFDSEYEY